MANIKKNRCVFVIAALFIVLMVLTLYIQYSIKVYGNGTETFIDVLEVNTLKEYIVIEEDSRSQTFITSHNWTTDKIQQAGNKEIERMGTTVKYQDKKGNQFTLQYEDKWCLLFREYTVYGKEVQNIL